MDEKEKREDSRLRKMAARRGYQLCKSRERTTHANNHGGYMIVEVERNTIAAGPDFDMSLEEVKAFLSDA